MEDRHDLRVSVLGSLYEVHALCCMKVNVSCTQDWEHTKICPSVYVRRLPSFCVACVARRAFTHTSPLDTNKTLKRGCSATTTGSSNFRVENEEHMFVSTIWKSGQNLRCRRDLSKLQVSHKFAYLILREIYIGRYIEDIRKEVIVGCSLYLHQVKRRTRNSKMLRYWIENKQYLMFDLQVDLQSPLLHSESSCQLVLTALLYVDASGGDGWYLYWSSNVMNRHYTLSVYPSSFRWGFGGSIARYFWHVGSR